VSSDAVSIEPILGWRVWHIDRRRGSEALLSWSQRDEWPIGRRMEATCKPGLLPGFRRGCGEAPRRGHSCGIYAVRRREDAEKLLGRIGRIGSSVGRLPVAIGRASLWGRVIENTDGWRAQFAYPYELFVLGGDARLARELRARYAVDVTLVSPVAPAHARPVGLRSG
jgi:hypothetical protein